VPFITDTFIRRAGRDDLDTVVRWMEEPDFRHFLYGDPARSPRQIREQIVAMLGRTAGHTMPGGIYLIIDSPSEGPIGLLSLQNLSWRNRSCTIDLYIDREKRHRKLVTAIALFRTLEYGFDELNLHRIGALIYAFNTASWRVLELAGAVRELELKKHAARDGELHDMFGYGLLREEFNAVRERHTRASEGFSLRAMIAAMAEGETDRAAP
jgi:RimJ/RimL family protein N-acetyltransferase